MVACGLGERSNALGLVARAHRRGERARPIAGFEPVVRDLGCHGRGVGSRLVPAALERGGEDRVDARSLAGKQFVVGDLAQQGMAEREALAARHQHVMANRLAQCVRERGLRDARSLGEERMVHLAATGRRRANDGAGIRIERADAGQQRVAQRR